MYPLEIFALDANMNRCTGVIPYTSLIWKRRYYECGEFSIDLPPDVYSDDWKYIYTADRPETGIIQKVVFTDAKSSITKKDTVTISGFFLESLLNRKTFLVEDSERTEWNRTPLSDLSTPHDNVAWCAKWVEIMMSEYMTVQPLAITGQQKVLEPSMKRLGDFVYSELQTVGASFRVFYDFEADTMTCEFWRGLDRTQSQNVNQFAVFSDTWGTMEDYKALTDDSNYRNKCYVLYEYDVPSRWQSNGAPYYESLYDWEQVTVEKDVYNPDGTEVIGTVEVQEMVQTLVGYNVPYRTMRGYHVFRIDDGLPDMETVLDKRNDTPSFDEEWTHGEIRVNEELKAPAGLKSKYDALPNTFGDEGKAFINENYPIVTNLDTGTLSQDDYLANWDIGDRVDVIVDSLGIEHEARIIGVDESYAAGKSDIRPTIGDEIKSSMQRARLF